MNVFNWFELMFEIFVDVLDVDMYDCSIGKWGVFVRKFENVFGFVVIESFYLMCYLFFICFGEMINFG